MLSHLPPRSTPSFCVVVPVYNHEHAVAKVVDGLCHIGLPVILIDDGSAESCAHELDRLASVYPQVALLRHTVNQGKGGAVMTGLRAAHARGFTHALQIDADGQHSLADVPRFIGEARNHPDSLVCGKPIFDNQIPIARLYGRYLSHALVWLETLSFDIPDSMCGMRLYPLPPIIKLINSTRPGLRSGSRPSSRPSSRLGSRMDFDIEILVRLHWQQMPMRWLATKVCYPSDGISHYRLVFDNLFVAGLHARLLLGMLWRMPMRLWRNFVRPQGAQRVTQ